VGPEVLGLIAITLGLSVVITWAAVRHAVRFGLLDRPNERSSHQVVTPRGGGVAIVVSASLAILALGWQGLLDRALLMAMLFGGAVVAIVGLVDDRRSVAPSVRLGVHLTAGAWAVAWFGGLPPLLVGDSLINFGWVGYLLAVVGVVWSLNLFNFMDGIDGIAAMEAMFVCCGGAAIAIAQGDQSTWVLAGLALGAACLGFLIWNWPPARIFMGDIGSGYLGYAIAILALADALGNGVALWIWLILGGVFFVDATVTLVRRLARGERAHQAHRTHAYQWLSRRWGSHRKVTLAVLAVNVFWLLPLAWTATRLPGEAYWLAIVALLPLVVAALLAGAGRPE
jgi:Fuc2NAc and GlcNAc transferase